MRETVVLVHGLWMTGLELQFLRRALERCGYRCVMFRYASVFRTPQENARRLGRVISSLEAHVVHLVAHSIGGIVILHLFEREPNQPPGRVLMIGTPLKGSDIARRIDRLPLLRLILGRSTQRGLLGDVPAWHGGRTLGMIAGTRGVGLGSLVLGGLQQPNDGTVTLAETRSAMVNRHLAVPASHLGMLWSPAVTDAVCRFLSEGEF